MNQGVYRQFKVIWLVQDLLWDWVSLGVLCSLDCGSIGKGVIHALERMKHLLDVLEPSLAHIEALPSLLVLMGRNTSLNLGRLPESRSHRLAAIEYGVVIETDTFVLGLDGTFLDCGPFRGHRISVDTGSMLLNLALTSLPLFGLLDGFENRQLESLRLHLGCHVIHDTSPLFSLDVNLTGSSVLEV